MSSERPAIVATSILARWGPVHLAASARGVVAVELMMTPEAFADGLQRRFGAAIEWVDVLADADSPEFDHLRVAAAAVIAAANVGIDGPDSAGSTAPNAVTLDIGDRPVWDCAVLEAVRAIPRGEVRSYGEIARAIGRPGAARAVGGAVGRNPIALLVPCHRVVAGDGTLGGYGGGWWGDHERLLDLKADLLAREGVTLPRSRPPSRR